MVPFFKKTSLFLRKYKTHIPLPLHPPHPSSPSRERGSFLFEINPSPSRERTLQLKAGSEVPKGDFKGTLENISLTTDLGETLPIPATEFSWSVTVTDVMQIVNIILQIEN